MSDDLSVSSQKAEPGMPEDKHQQRRTNRKACDKVSDLPGVSSLQFNDARDNVGRTTLLTCSQET